MTPFPLLRPQGPYFHRRRCSGPDTRRVGAIDVMPRAAAVMNAAERREVSRPKRQVPQTWPARSTIR